MLRFRICGLITLVYLITLNSLQAQEPRIASDPDYRQRLDPQKFLSALESLVSSPPEQPVAEPIDQDQTTGSEKLTIVWTSGDPEVAHRMVLMYGHAAKRNQWFHEVRLIIWGPSARLVASDKDIQAKLKAMQKSGITLEACVVCADSYGVSDQLRELGIEVKPMGRPLSNIIREKESQLITF